MVSASVSDLLHPPTHQAGKDCHHHFGLDFHEVLGESVDTRPDLPRHRDCVPGDQVQPHQAVSAGRKVNVVLSVVANRPPPPKKKTQNNQILLGILQLVVAWQAAGFDNVEVDAVGLDGIDQLQDC